MGLAMNTGVGMGPVMNSGTHRSSPVGEHHALELLEAALQLLMQTLETDVDPLAVESQRLVQDYRLRERDIRDVKRDSK